MEDDLIIFEETPEKRIKELEKTVEYLSDMLNRLLTEMAEIRSWMFDQLANQTDPHGRFHIQRIRKNSIEKSSSAEELLVDI